MAKRDKADGMKSSIDLRRIPAGDVKKHDSHGLEVLRCRFDERLAALRQPDAADRLRAIAKSPAKLHGKVKAGASY